jgi:hypothetical protein
MLTKAPSWVCIVLNLLGCLCFLASGLIALLKELTK